MFYSTLIVTKENSTIANFEMRRDELDEATRREMCLKFCSIRWELGETSVYRAETCDNLLRVHTWSWNPRRSVSDLSVVYSYKVASDNSSAFLSSAEYSETVLAWIVIVVTIMGVDFLLTPWSNWTPRMLATLVYCTLPGQDWEREVCAFSVCR